MKLSDMNLSDIFSKLGEHAFYGAVLDRIKHLVEILGLPGIGMETETAENIYTDSIMASVFLRHRKEVYGRLYERAFESGKDVLYVSIMSKDTLDDMRQHLECAKRHGTKLRVLTWAPGVGSQAIEAFRKHLGEYEGNRKGASDQVRQAFLRWKQLEKDFPTVITGLRSYASAPTMQGVLVKEEWALIELIPYHTTKDKRPALFLSAKYDRELWTLFNNTFSQLYDDNAGSS